LPQTHPASPLELRSLVLDVPLKLKPGETMGLYVHSGTEGDEQIVRLTPNGKDSE
jgi:hypothetical protein